MKKIYLGLARIALSLHNFSYKLIGKLAILAEGGVHPKHRLMNYHKFFVDNVDSGDIVLDIGCGNGFLTYDIAKNAEQVIGIDLNRKNIEQAKRKFSALNINYVVGNALKDIPQGKVDVIILSNVLEHIENRIEFLSKIRIIAPKTLIRVPMINRDWITLYKKELGIEYKLDRTHFVEYTLESFKNELEKAGLGVYSYTIQFGEIWAIIK